jgi:hypothetical protein
MALHLIKLSVGTESIEDLAAWQSQRLAKLKAAGRKPELFHTTFQTPKRRDELLAGGSIFWVIRGVIQARQPIFDLREGTKETGQPCCLIMLRRDLIPVRPTPRRAFQGWRYLDGDDAPPDLSGKAGRGVAEMPPQMRKELADLGLL